MSQYRTQLSLLQQDNSNYVEEINGSQYRTQLSLLQLLSMMSFLKLIGHNTARSYHCCNNIVTLLQ